MNVRSILVPLDGSLTASRGLRCATWLATRLSARLHVLNATDRPLSAREELKRLHVDEEHWPLVDLHHAPARPADAIVGAVSAHGVGLVVMTMRGEAVEATEVSVTSTEPLGRVTRGVIERCSVPVVLIPPAYREELPWQGFVVPVGGELPRDEAITLAAHLGHALDVTVHVVHVVDPSASRESLASRTHYSDAVHHEYPARVEELAAPVLPSLTPEQGERIHGADLQHGVLVERVTELMASPGSVLVLEWNGQFGPGRAATLKTLLRAVRDPVLLVRSAPPPQFHLKVGEEFG